MNLPEAGNWRLFHNHRKGFRIALGVYPNEVGSRRNFSNPELQNIVSRIEHNLLGQLKTAVYVFDIYLGFCESPCFHLRLRKSTVMYPLAAAKLIGTRFSRVCNLCERSGCAQYKEQKAQKLG